MLRRPEHWPPRIHKSSARGTVVGVAMGCVSGGAAVCRSLALGDVTYDMSLHMGFCPGASPAESRRACRDIRARHSAGQTQASEHWALGAVWATVGANRAFKRIAVAVSACVDSLDSVAAK